MGDAELRQVASGLREHYSLKPSKMLGFTSSGMVLAAKNEAGKVELVAPPPGAEVGERVRVESVFTTGEAGNVPWSDSRVKKYKVWEAMARDLRTSSAGVACWKGEPLVTSAGPCAVDSVFDAQIA